MEKRDAVLPTLRVPKSVAKRLKMLADRDGRTRPAFINRILESVATTGKFEMPEEGK